MLYQIKLCSAPCTGQIDKAVYASQVKLVEQFLNNKSDFIVTKLTKLMDEAAEKLAYEQAANYRDQVTNIRKVQTQQAVTTKAGNYDVVALVINRNIICVDILFVRGGLLLGNKSYFPTNTDFNLSASEILIAFLVQHYLYNENGVVPDKILVNVKLPSRLQIAAILSEKFKRKIVVSDSCQKAQRHLIVMAEANASNAIKVNYVTATRYFEQLLSFKSLFKLLNMPKRIECFDVSHMSGEAQVASCVVFDDKGPVKSEYRHYNINTVKSGDDYGALREALFRRYRDFKKIPDVTIVDGGLGQLNVAKEVLGFLKIRNVLLIAIAKGKERKPGLEEIYIEGKKEPLVLPQKSPALFFMQQIRDEAHRFAVSGHRKKMMKLRRRSILSSIPGVGAAKEEMLLKYFGGLEELRSAGVKDLLKIKGINRKLALRIYEHLHAE